MNTRMLFRSVFLGNELPDAPRWKVRSSILALTTAILGATITVAVSRGWIPEGLISEQAIVEISGVISTVVLTILGYTSVATSTRAGPTKKE